MTELSVSDQQLLDQLNKMAFIGEYDNALDKIQEQIQQSPHKLLYLELNLLNAQIFEETGNYSESLIYAEQAFEASLYLDLRQYIFRSMCILARSTWRMGELQPALEWTGFTIGQYYLLSKVNQNNPKNLEYFANNYNTLGNIYREFGEINLAMQYYTICMEVAESIDHAQLLASSLNNIGVIYLMRGDYLQSMEFFEKNLEYRQKQGNNVYIGTANNNLGEVYRLRGELDKALEYYEQSLEFKRAVGNTSAIGSTIHNVSLVLFAQAQIPKALENVEKALKYSVASGNNSQVAVILFDMIRMYVSNNDITTAQQYYHQLEEIAKQQNSKIYHLQAKLASALLYKAKARLKEILVAEELLTEVVDQNIIDNNLTIFALKHLAEIKLVELQVTDNQEVISEIKEVVNRLENISHKQNLHQIVVETYILQAKLALLEADIKLAAIYLIRAEKIAQAKGLNQLIGKINQEQEFMASEIDKWDEILEKRSIHEKLDMVKLIDYLKDVQNELF